MKHFIFLLIVILSGISQVHACGKYPIIPYPKSLQAMEGYFILKNNMQISVPFENKKYIRLLMISPKSYRKYPVCICQSLKRTQKQISYSQKIIH